MLSFKPVCTVQSGAMLLKHHFFFNDVEAMLRSGRVSSLCLSWFLVMSFCGLWHHTISLHLYSFCKTCPAIIGGYLLNTDRLLQQQIAGEQVFKAQLIHEKTLIFVTPLRLQAGPLWIITVPYSVVSCQENQVHFVSIGTFLTNVSEWK